MTREASSVREALAVIEPGDKVVVAGCSGVPVALLRGLLQQSGRLQGVTLYSGLLCGSASYDFLAAPHNERLRHVSWHMPYAFLKGVSRSVVEFLPISWARIDRFLSDLQPDVALIQVSPAEAGSHSLGVSVGYHLSAAKYAKTVIAEINERMPRTFGDSSIPAHDIDIAVASAHALEPFEQLTTLDPISERVGDVVAELIPNGAIIQIGVGLIPSATLKGLSDRRKRVSVYSLVTDDVVAFAERDGLCPIGGRGPSVVATESLGTERTWNFLAGNKDAHMAPSTRMHNTLEISKLDRFYAINSTLEIDLLGQCNSEALGGRQVSGIGGSLDFIEGSWLSAGGGNIVALPSTTREGRSRIVTALAAGTPITLPRHTLHTVVTEFGAAQLFGKSDVARRDALIGIAHPDHRRELKRAAQP